MFAFFESLLPPTARSPDAAPPQGLLAFYWHHARQAQGLLLWLLVTGLVVALLDITIPLFIGRVVSLLAAHTPAGLLHAVWPELAGMAAVLLVLRPAALLAQNLITNQAIAANLMNLIRWQNHWHVVRQSWMFFQNDFAGRLASRVLQTGPALRESVVSSVNAVWYILVYGSSAVALLSRADARLAWPMLVWFIGYLAMLRSFVPRIRNRSRRVAEARAQLTGRIVDSYTNILTVKLFARVRDEDAFVRDAVDEHTAAFRRQLRLMTGFAVTQTLLNAALMVGTGAVAVWLWSDGRIAVGTVAMALPMAWQITARAGWVAQNVTSTFENIGTVQDGMRSIAVPRLMADRPEAGELRVAAGAIRFEQVRFDYGRTREEEDETPGAS